MTTATPISTRNSSPLCCRYNGAMLGLLLTGAFSEGYRLRYPRLRKRMQLFLDELAAGVLLPGQHGEFIDRHPELTEAILTAVRAHSEATGDFFLMTSLAVYHVLMRRDDPDQAAEFYAEARDLAAKHGLPSDLLQAFTAAIPHDADDEVANDAFHRASLHFVGQLLEALPLEKTTAYVAIPHEDRAAETYLRFHAPLLQEAGCAGIMNWGGPWSENSGVLFETLLDRCGLMVADISMPDPTVFHEIGWARGRGMRVHLLAEKSAAPPLALLNDLPLHTYNRNDASWSAKEIETCRAAWRGGD